MSNSGKNYIFLLLIDGVHSRFDSNAYPNIFSNIIIFLSLYRHQRLDIIKKLEVPDLSVERKFIDRFSQVNCFYFVC